jgi:hypothetical protein
VGLVVNEKGEFFVGSIRSYCSLDLSKGNLCLLSVITLGLQFLGPSELSVSERLTYITSLYPIHCTLRQTEPLILPSYGLLLNLANGNLNWSSESQNKRPHLENLRLALRKNYK